ncbi:4-(cytidine 5'-diphospho)-2-C-methyl-D-erythritol kinase [Loigolactobacillus zhaoyuanensis]|uniref:4-diphosphocytidyl-2-C-methyl-D-erythritol kinase n=1 Tax=Loigolactobacillus zhaoyuanensis TaxID=2486017 RepID=A0ABW8UBF9_9LACO|nr:4-(cytidine 5'-diphospho)-2-C-methyl-D-erythritol kinase [Loigolactobacillus zhaoyuanensis]
MEITEKAPAKINLSLDALFQHADGEHEWKMVMTSVDLADYVDLARTATRQITVTTDSGFLPVDQRNLAFQAAQLLQQKAGVTSGARIHIRKQIPVAAGLGGGSSDAAAVLRGLNRLWQLNWSLADLAHLGLAIDSDVPYCVYSQTALVTGRGDQVTLLPKLPPFWVVIAKPSASVSTPSILRSISYDAQLYHPPIEQMVAAIHNNNYEQILASMGNTLAEITSQRYPQIKQLQQQMLRFGADAAQMSGSGPTVFGLCAKYSRAQHVFNSMKGFCHEVYLVRPLLNGLN